MTPDVPNRNSEVIAKLGREIYERRVCLALTSEDHGKFVAIDVATEEYEVDNYDYEAITRLSARQPSALLWLMRVGYGEESAEAVLRRHNAYAARVKLIPLFGLTTFSGTISTVGLIASWVANIFADGNIGCAAVCTMASVFCVPLLIGSIQTLRGRRSGLLWLKFGSLIFILHPDKVIDIWCLGNSPEYKFYLEWLANRSRSRPET